MSTTPEALPKRKSFVKVTQDAAFVRGLYKEAKRVGYTVKKTQFFGSVTDPENKDALVFKTCKMGGKLTSIIFSTEYWQDPLDQMVEKQAKA